MPENARGRIVPATVFDRVTVARLRSAYSLRRKHLGMPRVRAFADVLSALRADCRLRSAYRKAGRRDA